MAYRVLRQGGKIFRSTVVSGGFSPLDYTPIAWYDSSDISTISKDISDRVSEWRDKSVNGYHLTQSVDLNKPIYSLVNGVVFDGVNDYMLNNFGTLKSQPLTYFVAYRYLGVTDSFGYLIDGIDASNRNIIYNGSASGNAPTAPTMWSGVYLQSTPMPKTCPYSSIFTGVFNGVNSKLYLNNVLNATGNTGTNGLNGITIGFRYAFNDGPLNGYIKEIIIYNSALTTEQITSVNNYLNSKYNIY